MVVYKQGTTLVSCSYDWVTICKSGNW